MKPVLAIAWDVDGTLIDSEPLHHAVLIDVCGRYGLDLGSLSVEALRGVHLPDVWTLLAPRLPAGVARERWIDQIVTAYVDRARSLVPLPGAREAVAALAARGFRQVCVSNSSRRIVDANIRALGIGDVIAFSLSLDDVAAGKPDPEPYRRACRMLGLQPASVAAVEDSSTGVASARAAGLVVIGYAPAGEDLPGVDLGVAELGSLPARLLVGNGAGGAASDPGPPPLGV